MIGSLSTGVLLYLELCVLYWCMIGSLGTGVLLYLERCVLVNDWFPGTGVLLYLERCVLVNDWFPEYMCTAVPGTVCTGV